MGMQECVNYAKQQADNSASSAVDSALSANDAKNSAKSSSDSAVVASEAAITAIEAANGGDFSNSILKGAVGEISSPLLDLPLKNSLIPSKSANPATDVTFTRSTTATYVDRYGVLQTAQIDEPRFEKEGLLIEGESTNLATYSEDFSTMEGGVHTVETNTTIAPDLTMSADTMTVVGTQSDNFGKSFNSTGTIQTASIFLNIDSTATWIRCRQSVTSGSVSTYFNLQSLSFGFISFSASVKKISEKWVRVDVQSDMTNETGSRTFSICPVIDNGSSIADEGKKMIVFGLQIEPLPFVTSYKPTIASAVTRGADLCYLAFKDNCPEFVNDEFSVHVEFDTPNAEFSKYRQIVAISYQKTPQYNMLRLEKNSKNVNYYRAGIGEKVCVVNGNPQKSTITIKNDLVSIYNEGVLLSSTTQSVYYRTYTSNKIIGIGNRDETASASPLYGHIKNLKIFDKALSPTEVALLG